MKPEKMRPLLSTRPMENVAKHPSAVPTHDDIARRAYDIYLGNGCKQGHCKQNWRQAEQELSMRPRGATSG